MGSSTRLLSKAAGLGGFEAAPHLTLTWLSRPFSSHIMRGAARSHTRALAP